jgi:hypothetical protein
MLRLRTLLLSGLAAASLPLAAACAPALDFNGLTGGSKTDAAGDGTVDAQEDGNPPTDAASESSSPDAGTDSPGDASSSTDAVDAIEEYSANPCANVPAIDNGYYCGRTTQSGFSGGNPLYVYHCVSGMVTNVTSCGNGCFIAPNGYEDECDECNVNGDGPYCGSQFGYTMPSDRLLIICASGHVADGGIHACDAGCVVSGGAHCGP